MRVGGTLNNGGSVSLPVLIGDFVMDALIDSGSPFSFISHNYLPSSFDAVSSKRQYFKTVLNHSSFVVDSVVRINFFIGDTKFSHEFAVLLDSSFPVILGTDFLKKEDAKIDLQRASLALRDRKFPLSITTSGVSSVNHSCTTNNSVNRHSFVVSDDLSRSQRRSLDSVLFNFSDRFSTSEEDLGTTSLVRHKIQLHDTRPHKLRPLRQPEAVKQSIDSAIHTMLKNGIIRPSSSAWVSPCFLVKKKEGGYRFVVDYRKLNAKTIRDCFPIPLVQDLLDKFSGCQYFTTLDLRSGFWQVSLDEESKQLTAFQVGNSLYEFNVMPFGIRNAPATFQRLLQTLFVDANILPYIDDIIVASPNFSDHLQSLRSVFEKLRSANLKLNISKCKFAQPSVIYLGHLISGEGIKPDPSKVSSLLQTRPPRSFKELATFCGFANYLSKFVPRYSDTMAPIYNIKRKKRFEWTNECETAFRNLLNAVSKATLLHYPDFSEEFFLDTDASNVAISGVLYQSSGPIAFYSRTLRNAEFNYSTTDREFLGLVESVQHFRSYLLGRKFRAFTDHQALPSMLKRPPLNTRHARYIMKLEEFDFELLYKKGSQNIQADFMSRMTPFVAAPVAIHSNVEEWRTDQAQDPDIKQRIEDIRRGRRPVGFTIDESGLLCYYGNRVIPAPRIDEFIRKYHSCGHFSTSKVRSALLSAGYWFPKMRQRIVNILQDCSLCPTKSGSGVTVEPTCLPTAPSMLPFQMISTDIVGPLATQRGGYRFILTIIDHCTRWLEAIPLTNINAQTCASAIRNNWILRYGPPQVIHSDRGSQFCSSVWAQLLSCYGIQPSKTTAYNPQGNSLIERVHRTLKDRLIVSQKPWYESLQDSVYSINTSMSTATGQSPFELVFGRTGANPYDWPSITRKSFNVSNRPHVGDFVTVRVLPTADKLSPKFSGRFKVVSRPTHHTAVLSNEITYNLKNLRVVK